MSFEKQLTPEHDKQLTPEALLAAQTPAAAQPASPTAITPAPAASPSDAAKNPVESFKQAFFKQLSARFSSGNPTAQRQAMSAETVLHNMEEVKDKSRQDYALAASGSDKPRRKPHRSR